MVRKVFATTSGIREVVERILFTTPLPPRVLKQGANAAHLSAPRAGASLNSALGVLAGANRLDKYEPPQTVRKSGIGERLDKETGEFKCFAVRL